MKTVTSLIAACVILAACDAADPTTPQPPTPVAQSTFTLSATVRDQHGRPVGGARAIILQGESRLVGRQTLTNESGTLSYAGVSGEVRVKVFRGDYETYFSQTVTEDVAVTVTLQSSLDPEAIASNTIVLGRTIRSFTNETCHQIGDVRSACRKFLFEPPVNGRLVIAISSAGWEVEAWIWEPGVNQYERSVGTPTKVTLAFDVLAGRQYTIQVDAFNDPTDFDLRADLEPAGS
jgi:hypothetical protein